MGREALVIGERDDRGASSGASAFSSARAMAVRFRNASAVMPDDTWANPLVGSEAGQPITKFAALNGVCWPIEDLAGVDERVDQTVDRASR